MADILVVDDELGIRNVLSEILVESGHYVTTAANAQEAKELVKDHKFSVVLLDIWMPGMDGLELLKEWNRENKLEFPVVIMSGHATIDSAKEALQEGAVDFLEKPISLKKLLDSIDLALIKWHDKLLKEEAERKAEDNRRRRKRMMENRPNLPKFEIPEYNLTLDFNRPFREVLLAVERAYFLTVLRFVNHSVVGLSRHAGLERTHLYRKVRSLGIDMEAYREASRLGLDKDPLVFTHGPEAPRRLQTRGISASGSSLIRSNAAIEEACAGNMSALSSNDGSGIVEPPKNEG